MLLERSDFEAFAGFSPSHSLFKRCVSCDGSPACPTCKTGETCTMTSPTCNECATTKCVPDPNSKSSDGPPPKKTNAGAIAGGVIGGVAALAIILFLIWWFVIRPRRADRAAQQEKNDQFGAARSERKSTQSIASTVLTRASNVIQIAYIPGVTNRSPPETPHTLVPPVPPLPGATPDQHFFMPGDLRDSSWTGTTGHQSFSPTMRSSVATTIYRNDAVVSAVPAQQIQRSRANIVSVHNDSGASTPNGTVQAMVTPKDAPAVPAITSSQLAKAEASGPSSIVARTVTAKPVMVRGASVKKKDGSPVTAKEVSSSKSPSAESDESGNSRQFDHNTSTFDGSSSDEEDEEETKPSNPPQRANTVSVPRIEEEHSKDGGPFQDTPQRSATTAANPTQRHSATSSNISPRERRSPPPRVQSPFSDANEVK